MEPQVSPFQWSNSHLGRWLHCCAISCSSHSHAAYFRVFCILQANEAKSGPTLLGKVVQLIELYNFRFGAYNITKSSKVTRLYTKPLTWVTKRSETIRWVTFISKVTRLYRFYFKSHKLVYKTTDLGHKAVRNH